MSRARVIANATALALTALVSRAATPIPVMILDGESADC
jgi:hypothetical protein